MSSGSAELFNDLNRDGDPFPHKERWINKPSESRVDSIDRADAKLAVDLIRDDPRPQLMVTVGHDRDIITEVTLLDELDGIEQVLFGIHALILDQDPLGINPIRDHSLIETRRFTHRLVRSLTAACDRFHIGISVKIDLSCFDPLL